MKKVLSIIIAGIFSVSLLLSPVSVHAQIPAYAGIASFSLPCLCSGTIWVWFTPLYLATLVPNTPILPLTGPVVYSPYSTVLFAYYMIGIPGVWHLGSYIPGVQACWQPIAFGCAPLPAAGVMFLTGTGRLGK